MKIFIVADTHFHHANIIDYSKRPFKTTEEMDFEMVRRWNNKVGKDDIVIHLGDFALGNSEGIKKLKDKLNGNIILLKGNHDKKVAGVPGFLIVNGSLEIENIIFSHNPLSKKDIPKGLVNVHGHVREIRDFSEHLENITQTRMFS